MRSSYSSLASELMANSNKELIVGFIGHLIIVGCSLVLSISSPRRFPVLSNALRINNEHKQGLLENHSSAYHNGLPAILELGVRRTIANG